MKGPAQPADHTRVLRLNQWGPLRVAACVGRGSRRLQACRHASPSKPVKHSTLQQPRQPQPHHHHQQQQQQFPCNPQLALGKLPMGSSRLHALVCLRPLPPVSLASLASLLRSSWLPSPHQLLPPPRATSSSPPPVRSTRFFQSSRAASKSRERAKPYHRSPSADPSPATYPHSEPHSSRLPRPPQQPAARPTARTQPAAPPQPGALALSLSVTLPIGLAPQSAWRLSFGGSHGLWRPQRPPQRRLSRSLSCPAIRGRPAGAQPQRSRSRRWPAPRGSRAAEPVNHRVTEVCEGKRTMQYLSKVVVYRVGDRVHFILVNTFVVGEEDRNTKHKQTHTTVTTHNST